MISPGQFLGFLDKAIAAGLAVDRILDFAKAEIPELSEANQEGIPDVAGEILDERERALKR